jgi:hypothetical protein
MELTPTLPPIASVSMRESASPSPAPRTRSPGGFTRENSLNSRSWLA